MPPDLPADEVLSCPRCQLPVKDGDPIYSVTGAHWECHEEAVIKPREALRSGPMIIVKANGGILLHVLRDGSLRALCGQEPFNKMTGVRKMQRRGYWLETPYQFEALPADVRTCHECFRRSGRVVTRVRKDRTPQEIAYGK